MCVGYIYSFSSASDCSVPVWNVHRNILGWGYERKKRENKTIIEDPEEELDAVSILVDG